MRKITITLAAVIIAGFFTGCVTTGSNGMADGAATVESVLPFVRPGVSAACSIVLQSAISGQDRIDKAKIINAISNAVASLAGGKAPTVADLSAAIAAVAPDKAHWANFSKSVAGVYASSFDKYIKGDAKLAAQVLEQVCLGCRDATEPYM